MSMPRLPRHALRWTYLALLIASSAVRWHIGQRDARRDDLPIAGPAGAPPVLILPDARDDPRTLAPLVARLADSFRVFVHDAEVSGSAGASFAVQADTVGVVLARLGWPSAHLVAFGTSGGTAIDFAAKHPDAVRSMALVSAIGVEEFDLLGEHHLNQALRHGELVFLWTLRNLTPNFGVFDRDLLAGRRARVLARADRRGIRTELARWQGPTLILHAVDDPVVPAATAREHARVLPQSTLRLFAGDHPGGLLSFDEIAGPLHRFLGDAERGDAATRATAPADRVAAAARPFDPGGLASAQGRSLFVVLVLLALVTLLSEDLACVAAGVLAARGSIPLDVAIIACYVGIVAGDQLLYLLGRAVGRPVLRLPPFKWLLSEGDLDRAVAWFDRRGMGIVITSRLLPGTRFPVYVAAGVLRAGFVRFAVWLAAIGLVWTPLVVGGSYLAAKGGRNLIESLPGATWVWAVVAVLLMTVGVRQVVSMVGKRTRKAD